MDGSLHPSSILPTMDNIGSFTPTSVGSIPSIHEKLTAKFHSHSTKSLDYRLKQLRALYWGLKDAESALLEACKLDLGKSRYEAYMTEVGWVLNDIIFMNKNLERFMKDEKPDDIDLTNSFMKPRIRKDPLGAILIIGAFNFPLQLSLGPLIGAIAAGCTAILKVRMERLPWLPGVHQHFLVWLADSTPATSQVKTLPMPPGSCNMSSPRVSTTKHIRLCKEAFRRPMRFLIASGTRYFIPVA